MKIDTFLDGLLSKYALLLEVNLFLVKIDKESCHGYVKSEHVMFVHCLTKGL